MRDGTARRGPLRGMLWMVLLAIVVGMVFVVKIRQRMPDYEVYRRAALRARAAEPLYRPDDGHFQFKYLPGFAVAVIPLGLVSDGVARTVWFAASVGLLVFLLRVSVDVLPERRRKAGVLVGATFVLLA